MALVAEREQVRRTQAGTMCADQVVCRGIEFGEDDGRHVTFAIMLANEDNVRSAPTDAIVSAALFGAFLPWKEMATIPVPPLRPGQVLRRELRLIRPRAASPARHREEVERHLRAPSKGNHMLLPPSLLERDGVPKNYWAGNFNVFVGRRSVERHLARALRIEPGRRNRAKFRVGDGRLDAYRFSIDAPGGWPATLQASRPASDGHPVPIAVEREADQLVERVTQAWLTLWLDVPSDAVEGRAVVGVHRIGTGERANVEFELDSRAAGPGCYVV